MSVAARVISGKLICFCFFQVKRRNCTFHLPKEKATLTMLCTIPFFFFPVKSCLCDVNVNRLKHSWWLLSELDENFLNMSNTLMSFSVSSALSQTSTHSPTRTGVTSKLLWGRKKKTILSETKMTERGMNLQPVTSQSHFHLREELRSHWRNVKLFPVLDHKSL